MSNSYTPLEAANQLYLSLRRVLGETRRPTAADLDDDEVRRVLGLVLVQLSGADLDRITLAAFESSEFGLHEHEFGVLVSSLERLLADAP